MVPLLMIRREPSISPIERSQPGRTTPDGPTHLLVLSILYRIPLEHVVRRASQIIHQWLQWRLEVIRISRHVIWITRSGPRIW